MSRKEAQGALKDCESDTDFYKKWLPKLKQRKTGKKSKEFFVELKDVRKSHKDFYEENAIEYDEEAQQVEDVLGDVTDLSSSGNVLTEQLNQAKLDNITARTKYLNEKLDARKQELFTDWSSRFFEVFCTSFAKLKNFVVELHLSDEQLNVFNDKLDDALKSMEDRLTQINNEWMEEEEQEQL